MVLDKLAHFGIKLSLIYHNIMTLDVVENDAEVNSPVASCMEGVKTLLERVRVAKQPAEEQEALSCLIEMHIDTCISELVARGLAGTEFDYTEEPEISEIILRMRTLSLNFNLDLLDQYMYIKSLLANITKKLQTLEDTTIDLDALEVALNIAEEKIQNLCNEYKKYIRREADLIGSLTVYHVTSGGNDLGRLGQDFIKEVFVGVVLALDYPDVYDKPGMLLALLRNTSETLRSGAISCALRGWKYDEVEGLAWSSPASAIGNYTLTEALDAHPNVRKHRKEMELLMLALVMGRPIKASGDSAAPEKKSLGVAIRTYYESVFDALAPDKRKEIVELTKSLPPDEFSWEKYEALLGPAPVENARTSAKEGLSDMYLPPPNSPRPIATGGPPASAGVLADPEPSIEGTVLEEEIPVIAEPLSMPGRSSLQAEEAEEVEAPTTPEGTVLDADGYRVPDITDWHLDDIVSQHRAAGARVSLVQEDGKAVLYLDHSVGYGPLKLLMGAGLMAALGLLTFTVVKKFTPQLETPPTVVAFAPHSEIELPRYSYVLSAEDQRALLSGELSSQEFVNKFSKNRDEAFIVVGCVKEGGEIKAYRNAFGTDQIEGQPNFDPETRNISIKLRAWEKFETVQLNSWIFPCKKERAISIYTVEPAQKKLETHFASRLQN